MTNIISTIDSALLPGGREWYYEKFIGSDTLLITVGDSWTWGDSLGKTNLDFDDKNYRVNHIYGMVLSNKLNSDFINIGVPGGSNLFLLELLIQVLDRININYARKHIVFTMTESGRELQYHFSKFETDYLSLREPNWPTFFQCTQNLCNEHEYQSIDKNLKHTYFGFYIKLFRTVRQSHDLFHLLKTYEKCTVDLIRAASKDIVLARNFTSSFTDNQIDIDQRWVDVISRQGALEAYPNDLFVMSGLGINPLIEFCDLYFKNFDRSDWLSLLDTANKGIDWLKASPYNCQQGTKHPSEQAHIWWADHLYSYLNQ